MLHFFPFTFPSTFFPFTFFPPRNWFSSPGSSWDGSCLHLTVSSELHAGSFLSDCSFCLILPCSSPWWCSSISSFLHEIDSPLKVTLEALSTFNLPFLVSYVKVVSFLIALLVSYFHGLVREDVQVSLLPSTKLIFLSKQLLRQFLSSFCCL